MEKSCLKELGLTLYGAVDVEHFLLIKLSESLQFDYPGGYVDSKYSPNAHVGGGGGSQLGPK